MPLKIKPGAASMSYDLRTSGYCVATVWAGKRQPTDALAHRNALVMAASFDMQDALRAAIDRLEWLGDDSSIIAPLKRALPRMPEPEID